MSSLKNFGLQSRALEEWVPWGGIVHPNVMKQKDGSFFAIMEYKPYTIALDDMEEHPAKVMPFRRGWVLWAEHQHVASGESHDYFVLCWNPFYSDRKYVSNSLRPKVDKKKTLAHFLEVLTEMTELMQTYTEVRLLAYQEIMDVLSFTLSGGGDHKEMPEVPLYMDALLTQDLHYKFHGNHIRYQDKELFLCSFFSPEVMDGIYAYMRELTFRHTRRLTLFNQKEAKANFLRYSQRWFPNRKVLRKFATESLFSNYNGYYLDNVQAFLPEETYKHFRAEFSKALEENFMPYLFEDYNLKECFSGSLPGLFLANNRPPHMAFTYLAEFLHGYIKPKSKKQDILEDAASRLVPTTVDVSHYIDGHITQNLQTEEGGQA